jgi:methionyl-tRNA synthetase
MSVRSFISFWRSPFLMSVVCECAKDWSNEQLQKHSHEIQSLVGNFYLRITSPKITSLVASDPPLEGDDESFVRDSHPENDTVLSSLSTLAQEVESSLNDLEMSQALEHITSVLRRVSPLHNPSAEIELAHTDNMNRPM